MLNCLFRTSVAVVAASLLGAGTASSQSTQVLILPQDDQVVEDVTVAGTQERDLPSGLSRLTVPNTQTTYYIVDEVDAARGNLFNVFADIWRNDSDISIGYDQYRSEFIHLRIRNEVRDMRYIKVEPALLFQVSAFFRDGGYPNGAGSIEFLEYQRPISNCPELDAAIERMERRLQESVSPIYVPLESEEVVVDGINYQLRLRMGRALQGTFEVGENSGPLFDEVHSIMVAVRECSTDLEPEVRTREL